MFSNFGQVASVTSLGDGFDIKVMSVAVKRSITVYRLGVARAIVHRSHQIQANVTGLQRKSALRSRTSHRSDVYILY